MLSLKAWALLRSASQLFHHSLWLLQWLSFIEFEIPLLTPLPLNLEKSLICNKCRILCIVYNVLLHAPLPSGVLLQQWHKRNVDVDKSDFGAINLFGLINPYLEPHMFGRKDLLYMNPAKRDGLYIAKKIILKVLFWLWDKQRGWKTSYKHIDRIAVKFKACNRSSYICINICTDLL